MHAGPQDVTGEAPPPHTHTPEGGRGVPAAAQRRRLRRHWTPVAKNLYWTPAAKNLYWTPAAKNLYWKPAAKNLYWTPAAKNLYWTPAAKNLYWTPAAENLSFKALQGAQRFSPANS